MLDGRAGMLEGVGIVEREERAGGVEAAEREERVGGVVAAERGDMGESGKRVVGEESMRERTISAGQMGGACRDW
jgi:hypothetical protein